MDAPAHRRSAPTNALTLPISGTGSAGMEACFVNLLEPGDTAIVGVNGVFGERMCEVARRCGAEVVRVEAAWGRALDPQRLLDAQRAAPARAPASRSCTRRRRPASRTTIAPLAALRDTDTLLLVDTVTSLGGIPVEIDGWGVDAVLLGHAEVPRRAARPLAGHVLAARRRADRRPARRPPQSWYLDLGAHRRLRRRRRRVYHHTAPISMVFALHAGLGALLDEGLEAAWARHRAVGARLQDALPELGFRLSSPRTATACPQLTSAWLPDGADDATLRKALLDRPTASRSAAGSASSPARPGASASWATRRASARSPPSSARCASCSADLTGRYDAGSAADAQHVLAVVAQLGDRLADVGERAVRLGLAGPPL